MANKKVVSLTCLSLSVMLASSLAGCACVGTIHSDLSQVSTPDSKIPLRTLPEEIEPKKPSEEEAVKYGDSRDELIDIIEASEERRIGGIPTYEEYARGTADTSEIQNKLLTLIQAYGANASVAVRYLPDSAWDFSVNGEVSHPAASLIGLALLTQIYDRVDSGTLDLSNEYILTESSIVGGDGTLQNTEVGSMVTLDELIYHMLTENDNTATNMLIDIVGADATNAELQRQGLEGTSLERYMMDTYAQELGMENRISADDAADILAAIAQNIFYNQELSKMTVSYLSEASTSSKLTSGLSAGRTYAYKTGNLDSVTNEGIIVLGNNGYVLVVLVEGLDELGASSLMSDIATIVEGWALG